MRVWLLSNMEWSISCCICFIHSFCDICYYRVSRKTYTCAAHVQSMLFRAGGSGVCGCLCLYERETLSENAYSRAGHFLTWISCLLLLACISSFQSTPCLFCGPLYSAVTLGLVMYKCVFKAGLIVLLNVIYVPDIFAHKVNVKPYCTM